MQQIHATFNALLQLQIPTLATHNLPALEHPGVAQICFIKPWYLEGFVTGHIYDYKANKTHKKTSITNRNIYSCFTFSLEMYAFFRRVRVL